MNNSQHDDKLKQSNFLQQKEQVSTELKNQNPNQHHNIKKASLGPNTKQ